METAEEDLQVRDREELKGQTDKRIKRTDREKTATLTKHSSLQTLKGKTSLVLQSLNKK